MQNTVISLAGSDRVDDLSELWLALQRRIRRRARSPRDSDLQVAVMVGNADAQRFYERRGLRAGETVLYRFGPHPTP